MVFDTVNPSWRFDAVVRLTGLGWVATNTVAPARE